MFLNRHRARYRYGGLRAETVWLSSASGATRPVESLKSDAGRTKDPTPGLPAGP